MVQTHLWFSWVLPRHLSNVSTTCRSPLWKHPRAPTLLSFPPHVGSIPSWGRTFLCGVCMFSPSLLGFPPGTPISYHSPKTCRVIGYSKLPVRVNMSMKCCLSLFVSPVINWHFVQSVTCPKVSWNRLQASMTL